MVAMAVLKNVVGYNKMYLRDIFYCFEARIVLQNPVFRLSLSCLVQPIFMRRIKAKGDRSQYLMCRNFKKI